MPVHALAGRPAPDDRLVDLDALRIAYYAHRPDLSDRSQRVTFGTSGHRGSALKGGFNEGHVLAIAQAICDHRTHQRITGPLYLGKDTHALSEPAYATLVEVLAANRVEVMLDSAGECTPTPAVSRAILTHNRNRSTGLADGVVVTPSHNPPGDGGVKYNPPNGGPADAATTRWIEDRANRILLEGGVVGRMAYAQARKAGTTHFYDFIGSYVRDLATVVDMEAIKHSGLRIGVDPLGGAGLAVWHPIADRYGVAVEVLNDTLDPTFRFMPLDWDGEIRMDCSSPYAMARLVAMKDRCDLACGQDTDGDRHGIVTRTAGLMNSNHYLSAIVSYLFTHRPGWHRDAAIGKTIVTSSMIDRVAGKVGRALVEVPVGFKWFVPGLLQGSLGFGGEESAGASCLQHDGLPWTTDKDGIVMGLVAAELMARTGRDPSELYADLTKELGAPAYARVDAPASADERASLAAFAPRDVSIAELAGDSIERVVTIAPGNGQPIGGLKVVTAHGWFAARPSGTEPIYKLYAESFRGDDHLRRIQADAQEVIGRMRAGAAR